MSTIKRLFSIICICVLCVTAQAQVVIGVTRTGQIGTAGQNLEFVDQFGRIVAYPALSPSGEILDIMTPSVVTNVTVTDITKTSATTGGKVIAQGASPVTECGVCYGTSSYPTIIDSHLSATPDANGNFTVNLSGLQPNTTYYVRAYATNAIGTSYGTAWSFTTRGDANITITGKSETKVYNGSAQSVTGYIVTIPEGVNITEDQITYSGTATASGTDVGDYTMTLSANDFSCSNGNYDVSFQVTNGKLTITKASATVTITGNSESKTYNGSEQSVTGYAVSIPSGVNIQQSEINCSATATAKGTDVGTYNMGLTADAFSTTNGNYNVTFSVTDGKLTINKATATVTITGNSESKTYNGSEQSVTGYAVGIPSGVNIQQSEITCSATAEAKGTNADTYPMGLTQDAFSCTNGNYNVTFSVTDGTLTITKATATVTADDKTKVAGEADPELTATVEGTVGNDVLNYELSRATGETAGTYAITPSGDDVQGNYNVTYVPGTLTITLPACPTLGTTAYTPNPVTGNTITLNTPVNDVAPGVTVTPQYTATMGTTSVTVNNVSYDNANGKMTGSITITTAMRGKAITVTPSITATGCSSNPATITGDEVEICVPYATKPSFTAVSNDPNNPMAKTDLFPHKGVNLKATVSDYNANQVESYGFLISTNQSDIQSYSSEFAVHASKSGNNITSDLLGLSYCGKKWYYRAYIKLNGCEEPVLSTVNNFQMWGPESATSSSVAGPTVSASPASITQGQSVTLSATAYITVSSSFYNYLCNGIVGQNPIEWATHNCENVVSSYGLSRNNWTYRWEDESGNTIYSSHDSGETTVTPTQTTTYTAYGEFVYQNETCRVSKSVTVTVNP